MARCFTLAARPQGIPAPSDFRLEEMILRPLEDGEVLIRNILISVDPGMRARLSDMDTYAAPIPIGDVIEGASVGEIVESRNPKFAAGDIVVTGLGWREMAISNGRGLRKIKDRRLPLSVWIGVLGIPGMTGYFGIKRVGALKEGDTVLVSSAAGAVGSAAGQIAKRLGAGRVIGIAGGPRKCTYLTDECGFDAAIDYKQTADLAGAVTECAPDGIDIYFDNVGNEMLDAMLPLMKPYGRIVVSGQVADYNTDLADRPGIKNTLFFITKRLRMEGLVVFDDAPQFPEAMAQMADWIATGAFRYPEDIIGGFENLPDAFIGLFRGENFGRRLIRAAPDPV